MNIINLLLILWEHTALLLGLAYFADLATDGDIDLPQPKKLRFKVNSKLAKIGMKIANWLERM